MAYKLIGQDFTPPDVVAKVTGKAKYAEDFRAEGMLFCRLLTSPMPHARVRNIDASEALKLEGVAAVLTADDVPAMAPGDPPILAREAKFVGEPVAAVAALNETIAQDAIDRIRVDWEELPYTVDPLETLYPGGPDAVSGGINVSVMNFPTGEKGRHLKWTAADFAGAGDNQMPMGMAETEWSYGDIEAGFREAKLVLDESFVVASNAHHSMEPRSAMAYWENGKCYLYGSSQSQTFMMPGLTGMLGIQPQDLVYIAEHCGGGFGSKGNPYPYMVIPAYMSKKTNTPVMLRISRAQEYALGNARNGFQGRIKLGFRADGRLLAADLYLIQDNGSESGFFDYRSAGDFVSLVYQPESMRHRAVPVKTNTPWRRAQRGPGPNQMAVSVEPLMDKAARALDIDRLQIRTINNPDNNSKWGGERAPISSIYIRDVLEQGAEEFKWTDKKKLSGQRRGSKVIGVGIGQGHHPGGAAGFDGLVSITPDGILHIHSGVGNLGTFSHSSTSRTAAEVLGYDWSHCVVERGDSRKHLPWNLGQFGSNTSNTMSRTNYVAAMDALTKMKEIAAMDLGGAPGDYDIGGEQVFLKSNPKKYLSYAQAAQRALELGGKYDGHEMPEDIHPITKAAVEGLKGNALIGVARDKLPKTGLAAATAAGFMMIELDVETGDFDILDYHAVVDCGTVVHPMGLQTQIKGGAAMGIGMATLERLVYDPQNGLPANVGLYQAKPASYLDMPAAMTSAAVGKTDPENPLGIKGIGEPVMGCAGAALLCAIADAMGGDHYFKRTPVTPDMIVNALAGQDQSHKPLQTNTQ
jgi:CO/xanthine dehydrogenase Mo-binding subunit